MASDAAPAVMASSVERSIDAYRLRADRGDMLLNGAGDAWSAAIAASGGIGADRPLPLLIGADEWRAIEAGIAQRATLLETVLADLYGSARLVGDGALPASLVTGSPGFLRGLIGLSPPGGRHLRIAAFDLIRDPGGGWRVTGDRSGGLAGLGRALDLQLAGGRVGGPPSLRIAPHAPFYASLREGIAAACRRSEPRIAMLAAGRDDPEHGEAASLARLLGFLLVEGADLAALDERLYLRTIAGLKRVDALWSLVEPRRLDPLAFDAHAQDGVAGLIDAYAADTLVIANAPGAALIEAPAFAAFLPALAERLTGQPLMLPSVATWWGGGMAEQRYLERHRDTLRLSPAFCVAGNDHAVDRLAGIAVDLARRPQDYVGQEPLARATMPVIAGGALVPRGFTLRVFAARGGDDAWYVLPGGLAMVDGGGVADAVVHGRREPGGGPPIVGDHVRLRRNPGTLPSRAADGFYWLGRYLERAATLVSAIRALIDSDGAAPVAAETRDRLVALVAGLGAVSAPPEPGAGEAHALANEAMTGQAAGALVSLDAAQRRNGAALSERLTPDLVRSIAAPPVAIGGLADRAAAAADRLNAIAGLAAEQLPRTAGWRFLDLGRRIERAFAVTRLLVRFGVAGNGSDDLAMLLDLAESRASYRQRYTGVVTRLPAFDLVALDPANPRGLAFQIEAISAHLAALPVLADDGMAEPQQALAATLRAIVSTTSAARVDADLLGEIDRRLAQLSDAIARRYFLQGAEPLRASGLTLA